MTDAKQKPEATNHDFGLAELNEEVVKRLNGVLGAVANDFFQPKLEEQSEQFGEKISKQAEETRSYIKNLRRDHEGRLDSINLALSHLGEEFGKKIGEQAEVTRKEIKCLRTDHDDRLDSVDLALRNLGEAIDGHGTRLSQVDEKLGEHSSNHTKTQATLVHLQTEKERLEALLRQQTEVATGHESQLDQLNTRMNRAKWTLWFLLIAIGVGFYFLLRKP